MTHLPPHSKEKGFTPEDDQGEGSVTGWQPIETAPKDGSEFLAFGPQGICVTIWDASWRAFFSVPGRWGLRPTHWQPLPEPPSSLPSSLPEQEQA
jgi:hypothetical protein